MAQKTWTDLLGPFNPRAKVVDVGDYAIISLDQGHNKWEVLWAFPKNESLASPVEQAQAAYDTWKAEGEPKVTIKLTAEHQALLKLATMGRYLANAATDQRLASQRGCYGGFYDAFAGLIRTVIDDQEIAETIIDADLDIVDHESICEQIVYFCHETGIAKVILL